MERSIKHILHGEVVTEGAGVRLRRLFGYYEAGVFDPFLLLDDFRSDNPADYFRGFPWHPHRGIETITYVLRGDVEHGDSMGNKGSIGAGDVQWMTAGSGIVHQEMPSGDESGAMYGFQLWANLPATHKMMPPRYRGLTDKQIPRVQLKNGGSVKVIAGQVDGVQGPVQDVVVQPEYLDVTLPANVKFTHPTRRGDTVFIYAYSGSGNSVGSELKNPTLALYEDGEKISLESGEHGLSFLLISGTPINEPIAWRGPIVMNTDEEIALAFREYSEGTFIKS